MIGLWLLYSFYYDALFVLFHNLDIATNYKIRWKPYRIKIHFLCTSVSPIPITHTGSGTISWTIKRCNASKCELCYIERQLVVSIDGRITIKETGRRAFYGDRKMSAAEVENESTVHRLRWPIGRETAEEQSTDWSGRRCVTTTGRSTRVTL